MNREPSYNLVESKLADVRHLFAEHHAYASVGIWSTYCYAVIEDGAPVAAFTWQPPPPNSARVVCAECPQGVLSLSRMVAVPRDRRKLRHISKPLRQQMVRRIDRTRWPVLVTYSDESVGHTGHVYKCSGWTATGRSKTVTYTLDGRRVSRYSNGKTSAPEGAIVGEAWIQRWEHAVPNASSVFDAAWERVAIPGKTWRSGQQAHEYVRRTGAAESSMDLTKQTTFDWGGS